MKKILLMLMVICAFAISANATNLKTGEQLANVTVHDAGSFNTTATAKLDIVISNQNLLGKPIILPMRAKGLNKNMIKVNKSNIMHTGMWLFKVGWKNTNKRG